MAVIRIVHRALHRVGFDFVRYDADRFAELRRLPLLNARRIGLVLDVGANQGQYATELRDSGYRGRIVSFEPLTSAYRVLERRAAAAPEWETRNLALGERAGTTSIHVAGNSWSSSLLPMGPRHLASAPESAYVADEQVEVKTLDEIASEFAVAEERVWLKLDVQGYEMPVLRGADETLGRAEVVETELSLVELYEGQALFADVIAYLAERGFGTWSFEPAFRDPASGELLQIDGIFARRR